MIEPLVPKECFFTQGVGKHRNQLQSFELALRDAGIEMCNVVRVSSIFPPHCKLISKNAGLRKLQPGQVTYVVLAEASTNEPSRLVGASIGLALPAAGHQYGYISEHHGYGMTEQRMRDFVEDMAATMLATTLGIEFDPETAYDQRKEIYHMSGKIIKTRAVRRRPKATSWASGRRSSPRPCSCFGKGSKCRSAAESAFGGSQSGGREEVRAEHGPDAQVESDWELPDRRSDDIRRVSDCI